MHELILRAWRHQSAFYYLVLIPLSWVFSVIVLLRQLSYKTGLLPSYLLPVPVIIVGNINMVGSGKTPVVMWLVEQLKKEGFQPGVISRGYGVKNSTPTGVQQGDLAAKVGDEPLLIARRVGCPVWVGQNRADAGEALLKAHPECDVIISDDGLQHYRLQRNIELVVADQQTSVDKKLLPAGPLREPFSRLKTVDAVICNGTKTMAGAFETQLESQTLYNLANSALKVPPAHFDGKAITALAGIGKPERFFDYLKGLGLAAKQLSFEDHHAFTSQDLDDIKCDALIMTEKDAVKCEIFAKAHYWVLPVTAKMDTELLPMILEKLKASQHEINNRKKGVR